MSLQEQGASFKTGEPIALTDAEVESIERATLDAVVPDRMEHVPGWLLPIFDGTVGRARSAVPLQHGRADLSQIEFIAERYRALGFAPAFRLPELPAFDGFHAQLSRQGYVREQPSLTMVGRVE
ncbi:MAG TPA: hypothetical protein VFY22_07915, partial [Hydrogenophaga sp.]|nr:hypothetical protein [Hydrogenophaga sp.]